MKTATLICLAMINLFFLHEHDVNLQELGPDPHSLRAIDDHKGSEKENLIPAAETAQQLFKTDRLYFIPNRGQVDKRALFYAKTQRYTLWLSANELIFDSTHISGNLRQKPLSYVGRSFDRNSDPVLGKAKERDISRLVFLGANKTAEMIVPEATAHRMNYFIGNDASQWRQGVPTYPSVLYKGIYNQVDLRIGGRSAEIEYDWIIRAGGSPGAIRIQYQNVKACRLNEDGDIIVTTRFGDLIHKRPQGYQVIDEKKLLVDAAFIKLGANTYGLKVGEYDKKYELIIDPVILAFSTYLGGSEDERGMGIAANKAGEIIVVGVTSSLNFPVFQALDDTLDDIYATAGQDAFISKFNSSGTSLLFSTYLGGKSNDAGLGVALDSKGDIYLTGWTYSGDFPTKNAFDDTYDNESYFDHPDAFVTKLSATGQVIIFSTYLGGEDDDIGTRIAVDSKGAVCVTGYTSSGDFPTKNAFQSGLSHWPFDDAFITKINPSGKSLAFSTYFGGSFDEECWGIDVDTNSCIYITGTTDSPDFPLKNAFDKTPGYNSEAFISKFSSSGKLAYSTYLGGSLSEESFGIKVDKTGAVYVCGNTTSRDFPVINAFDRTLNGGWDVFISKISPSGTSLVFSTYLGGSGEDRSLAMALDMSGAVYITGLTWSKKFPIKNAFDKTYNGKSDVFVTRLLPSGKAMAYSTYLGGSGDETARSIALDGQNNAYVTGWTTSLNFPNKKAFDVSPNGKADTFLFKLSASY